MRRMNPFSLNWSLQKLTPIRGRKLFPESATIASALASLQKLTPIRGRKLIGRGHQKLVLLLQGLQKLTPIRGRKHDGCMYRWYSSYCLQKLTPIRGRKLDYFCGSLHIPLVRFTEANPDKGTETNLHLLL